MRRQPTRLAFPPSTPDDHSPPVPPLPIPNRTVKRRRADDSTDCPCESRSLSGTPQSKTPRLVPGRFALIESRSTLAKNPAQAAQQKLRFHIPGRSQHLEIPVQSMRLVHDAGPSIAIHDLRATAGFNLHPHPRKVCLAPTVHRPSILDDFALRRSLL